MNWTTDDIYNVNLAWAENWIVDDKKKGKWCKFNIRIKILNHYKNFPFNCNNILRFYSGNLKLFFELQNKRNPYPKLNGSFKKWIYSGLTFRGESDQTWGDGEIGIIQPQRFLRNFLSCFVQRMEWREIVFENMKMEYKELLKKELKSMPQEKWIMKKAWS